jgi:hypothetical protein
MLQAVHNKFFETDKGITPAWMKGVQPGINQSDQEHGWMQMHMDNFRGVIRAWLKAFRLRR